MRFRALCGETIIQPVSLDLHFLRYSRGALKGMARISGAFLILVLAIVFGQEALAGTKLSVVVTPQREVALTVDAGLHRTFGLAYPVTYQISIPTGGAPGSLHASVRHTTAAAWRTLPEKLSGNFFNGEEVVRFDYAAAIAYVSVGFDSTSDQLYIRIADNTDQAVDIGYQGICLYYDNRQTAVTASADDWSEFNNASFEYASNLFRSYNVPLTVAIITKYCEASTWARIQEHLNMGLIEAGSHNRTHQVAPVANPEAELRGSKEDILNNLTLPPWSRNGSRQYVYSYIAPAGKTDTTNENVLTEGQFLAERLVYWSDGSYVPWDPSKQRYAEDGPSYEMGPLYGGTTNLNQLNALFDDHLAKGKIYHVMIHPTVLTDGGLWDPLVKPHLQHICNRSNVWYVNYGYLYVYRLIADAQVTSYNTIIYPPLAIDFPTNQTVTVGQMASFSVGALGTGPLFYQWQRNLVNIPGANSKTYTIPAVSLTDNGSLFRCVVTSAAGLSNSASALLKVNSSPPASVNAISNGTFDSGPASWFFQTNGSGNFTMLSPGYDGGGQAAQVSISAVGSDIQLSQNNLYLEPNTEYVLTFNAYSNTGHNLQMLLGKQVAPGTNYGLSQYECDMTPGWRSYKISFTTRNFNAPVSDAAMTFWLAVDGKAGDVYVFDDVVLEKLSDILCPPASPPLVIQEPLDVTIVEGQPAAFTVNVTGIAPITLQWQKNGVDLPGANSATYNIAAAVRADNGAGFRCVVSNSYGKDTSRVALLNVDPTPVFPVLAGPASGSTNVAVSPVLSWYRTPGGSSYRLQVSPDSTFAAGSFVTDSLIADTTYRVSGLSFLTRYFWRVKPIVDGGQFSAFWSFTTIVGPAATPALVSPADATPGLSVASIAFSWRRAQGASTFRLQIATNASFAAGIAMDDSTIADTTRSVTTLQTDQHYYWRVSAKGIGGSSGFSTVWSFETIKTLPLATSLVSPVNGASGLPVVGLTFRWNSYPSATNYSFQLGTDSTFTAGLVKNDTALVDTARTVNGLSIGTRYFWRVRARNTAGWGSYTPAWWMMTYAPLPGQIVLVGPASGSTAKADTETFVWSKPTPGAARYSFEIGVDSLFGSFHVTDSTLTDTVKVFGPLLVNRIYYWHVRGWNAGGWGPYSETRSIRTIITSVGERAEMPAAFALEQNHPNPFNPSTKIGFALPRECQVKLEVYNMLGQKVSTIVDEQMQPGYHTVTFDASTLPSGMYLYRLVTSGGAITRKMILMK
jgi:hypothetical protein